jgi:hypothetical protein
MTSSTVPCVLTASQSGSGNYKAALGVGKTVAAAKAATVSTVSVTPTSQQYSDLVTLEATLSPASAGGVAPATGVTFRIGARTVGSATLSVVGSQIKATLTAVALTEAPGTVTVTAEFTGVNANFIVSSATTPLTVTQEDARAYYTGASVFWTSSTSSTSATVTLSATIKDITAVDPVTDPNGGNITNARVSFVSRDGTVLAGCIGLIPALVDPSNPLVGTVTCQTTSLSASSSGAAQYTIGIVVNNYYTRNNTDDDTVIDVAQPIATSFITGGGYLMNPATTAGPYAPDANRKTNFGFNVKYNKSGTNLQGNVNVIFRRGTSVYQIKSNALSSLGVKYCNTLLTLTSCGLLPTTPCTVNATAACPIQATFQGKANLYDVTASGTPVLLGGGLSLQMSMTDRGEPGSADSIAISLYNSLSNGSTLLLSSQWDGTRTTEKVLNGGNLVAH